MIKRVFWCKIGNMTRVFRFHLVYRQPRKLMEQKPTSDTSNDDAKNRSKKNGIENKNIASVEIKKQNKNSQEILFSLQLLLLLLLFNSPLAGIFGC